MIHGVRSFPGKHDDEKIIAVIRKHCIVHWIGIMRFIIIAVIPTAFGFALLLMIQETMNTSSFLIISAFLLLYFAFFTELALVQWFNEELSLIIITNFRAIDITQRGFLRRSIAETNLDQIQDVSGETCGIIGNLLNYGDLSIRTASNYNYFLVTHVPNPHLKSRQILDFVDSHHKGHEAKK